MVDGLARVELIRGIPPARRHGELAVDARGPRPGHGEGARARAARLHRISFEDPESTGELETTFEISGEQVLVGQRTTYKIRNAGPLAPFTDFFFVRRLVAMSMRHSLGDLKHIVESGLTAGASRD